jgi:PAS domain S-box-containing protein
MECTEWKNDPAASAPLIPGDPQKLIYSTGEMADLTRAFNWSETPVGPVEQWPDTLLITVNTLLASRFPMFLWWGDELTQFYNDAYRPSIAADKHPRALGRTAIETWPEIWPIIGPQIEAVMTRGEASWHEDQLVPIYRNGKLEDVYWTYSYSPVRDPDGTIRGTLVTCSETTQRKRLEIERASLIKELEQKRAQLTDLFQQAPAFFAVVRGPEHIFELTNPLYQELIGQRRVIGKAAREALPEADEQGFLALLDRVYQTGEPFVGHGTPMRLARTAGQPLQEHYLDFIYQPMRESDGTISGIIVLGVDVTESKRAEQVLVQTEKLAAVGRLASSIAHEINNPLESVTNLLYLVETTSEKEVRLQYLAQAQAELARAAKVATLTLRFHRQSTRARDTSLPEVLEGVLALTEPRLKNAGIRVERQYGTRRQITAYEADLRQVFANLVANAIDASEQGDRMILRVRDAVNWRSGAPGIRVSVADTGLGMSEMTRRRIFDPFFTTKGMTGTGLGLWVSAGILQNHNAAVRVCSSQRPERRGTVFSIFFPLDAANPGKH